MKIFITESTYKYLRAYVRVYQSSNHATPFFNQFLTLSPDDFLRKGLMAREIFIIPDQNTEPDVLDEEIDAMISNLYDKKFFPARQPKLMQGIIDFFEKDLGIISEHPDFPDTYQLNKRNTLTAIPTPIQLEEKTQDMKVAITEGFFDDLIRFLQNNISVTQDEALKNSPERASEAFLKNHLAKRGIAVIEPGMTTKLEVIDDKVELMLDDLAFKEIFYVNQPDLMEGLITFLQDDVRIIKKLREDIDNIYVLNAPSKWSQAISASPTFYANPGKSNSEPDQKEPEQPESSLKKK